LIALAVSLASLRGKSFRPPKPISRRLSPTRVLRIHCLDPTRLEPLGGEH
jgi:hypothetical protein